MKKTTGRAVAALMRKSLCSGVQSPKMDDLERAVFSLAFSSADLVSAMFFSSSVSVSSVSALREGREKRRERFIREAIEIVGGE